MSESTSPYGGTATLHQQRIDLVDALRRAADWLERLNSRELPTALETVGTLTAEVERIAAGRPALPLRIDAEAFMVLNQGIVIDGRGKVVAVYDTIEEAEKHCAEANGTDVETVQQQAAELMQRLHEIRTGSKRRPAPSRSKKR
ncbi:MAG TPA: hypothetical protein VEB21_15735 [Terriglobales bacterium]|nr:hypothetical protein [Terriglobales bacterium]